METVWAAIQDILSQMERVEYFLEILTVNLMIRLIIVWHALIDITLMELVENVSQ